MIHYHAMMGQAKLALFAKFLPFRGPAILVRAFDV
jgi:hypothetical protein